MSASAGTTTVALTYGGFGYGTVYFPSSITLGAGDIMKFHGGSGAGVPTFDVSVVIPGLGAITSPAPTTDGSAAIVDTSQDLSVTWSPISIGQVRLKLYAGPSSQGAVGEVAVSLACTFDGLSGSGVVPQTLVSSLKDMSGANPTYAGLNSELEATTLVDGLTIVTQSYQNSATPNHDFSVTLR